jgi:hypothetical protein
MLRRTWTEGGRRYVHYVTEVRVNNSYGVFSADYAVREEQWKPSTGSGQAVAIQIFHHPGHTASLGRMMASVRASLDYYTRQFGPYPYSYLKLIERPASMGVHTEAATVEYGEGFALLNPGDGPQDLDLVFSVVAHGVARGWWGMQVVPADVEGAGLLDVTLETYSAMRVVEETLGPEHLQRYLHFMRWSENARPQSRAARPLLRATGSFAFSRRGPFALYAMREYIGKERIDEALRRLFEKHRLGTPPLPTSMDLYRELQTVTPDQFQYLLQDLFERNTFWDLKTERATARQTAAGNWQVTLQVQARKVTVDEAGIEKELPLDDLVPIGVFAARMPGEVFRKPLYLQQHRIRSGAQTIVLTLLSGEPVEAGIDPDYLLPNSDGEIADNVAAITVQR